MKYYPSKARESGIENGEVAEVLAKAMAVAAGHKRLLASDAFAKYWKAEGTTE